MLQDPNVERYIQLAVSKSVHKLELEIAQLKFELREIRKELYKNE